MEGIIENLLDTAMELCYNERLDKRLIPCLLFGKPGDLGRLVVPLLCRVSVCVPSSPQCLGWISGDSCFVMYVDMIALFLNGLLCNSFEFYSIRFAIPHQSMVAGRFSRNEWNY